VVKDVTSCVVGMRRVMDFLDEVFENVAVVIQDGGNKGRRDFGSGGVIVVKEGVL